jgi:hypothetical protein
MAILALLLIYLMARPRRRANLESNLEAVRAAQWSTVSALVMGGFFLGGGPRSELALFALAGWIALALTAPSRSQVPSRLPASQLAAGGLLGVAAALALLLVLPAVGVSLARGAGRLQATPILYRQRLALAGRFNPFDPRIPLALATSRRQSMSETDPWDEFDYLRVVGLYRHAARLDPYDPSIPLRLAEFQTYWDRQEEAVLTVQQALERLPSDPSLIGWLYDFSERHGYTALAERMLRRAQQNEPARVFWWRERALKERQLGQLPRAARALAVAMTRSPGDPQLVRDAWRSNQPSAPPPAVFEMDLDRVDQVNSVGEMDKGN